MDERFVLQFRVELLGFEPPVWRRIEVPDDYSFWDLHVAIQDAMGWADYHLHVFHILGSTAEIGSPSEDFEDDQPIQPGWDVPIAEVFSEDMPLASYEYDFGDSWMHEVRFESYNPVEKGTTYPRCLAGARHCPPEDCGGVPGYREFLEVIRDPSHEEHESTLEWAGGSFDSEDFEPDAVRFDDPRERWRMAFGDADV